MTPSILVPESPKESVPKSSPPWVWVGFGLAFTFFLLETLMVVMDLDQRSMTGFLTLIWFSGFIYWLICLHRIHKILVEITNGRYPISGAEVVGKHFIPLYNVYWIFKWPAVMSGYLNERGRVRMISGYLIGAFILIGVLCRFLDSGVVLLIYFSVAFYVSMKLKQHVALITATLPENLPPILDPKIFGAQPLTSAEATQSVVD